MVSILPLRGRPHDQVRQLLAWYVNGTLTAPETAMVEAHLAACAECRAELAAEQALAGAVKDIPVVAGDGWAAMAARIAAGETPAGDDDDDDDLADIAADRRNMPVPFLKRRVAMGWVVAAPLAAACAAGMIVAALPERAAAPATYIALGTAPAARPGNLLLQFRPDTREARVRALIGAAGARLVDGPTATGAYVLRVDPERRPAAVRLLGGAPEVTLAQPIDPGP
ncbi:zf-HC2 domain-containing protein [Sphingomonas quercus]|uniref:Zf-HC2 domain-containing protein n=1 Tax=Sphingomonas quercus TaxID=2842451 RepID=A0ABS6BIV1_9SPHN|nr:zf-HC2 domain-containing protein [Sphingomonas quercus]MBU3078109.1 zf-HC2 domain-containing protein [Sphingomonas quercus]